MFAFTNKKSSVPPSLSGRLGEISARKARDVERELRAQLDSLQRDKDEAMQLAESQMTSLRTSVELAQEQVSDLQSQLEDVRRTRDALAAQVEENKAEMTRMAEYLQSEKERVAFLESRLTSASAEKEQLARQVVAWREVKARDEETIETLNGLMKEHQTFFESQLAAMKVSHLRLRRCNT